MKKSTQLKIGLCAALSLTAVFSLNSRRDVPEAKAQDVMTFNNGLPQDVRDFASFIGVQTTYPHEGFSEGIMADGRRLGLRFGVSADPCNRLGGSPTVYNLDDPAQAAAFQSSVDEAYAKERVAETDSPPPPTHNPFRH